MRKGVKGEVLAVRLGVVRNRNDHFTRIFERAFNSFFKYSFTCKLLPEACRKTWVVSKLFKIINYDVWSMFDQLGCDRIYDDKAVCSGRSHRIQGLGTEVCVRSERLAADLGCTHTFAAVTSLYSQVRTRH